MRKKKKRKKRSDKGEGASPPRMISERLTNAILATVLIAMAGLLVVLVWQQSTRPIATDYEGTIVDKWAKYADTSEGSRPLLHLVVEVDGGEKVTVRVNPNVYESARIGMRIRAKSGQVELIDSGQKAINNR